MDFIFSASIIASFIAGMVALFAPCCITVLLPTYLASVFRAKKAILKMTFIFFAGMAIILIPIGLGASALAQIFSNFHKEMYIIGGIFMLALGLMALAGRGLAIMPMPKMPAFTGNSKSVFILGIFSGAATSCCAPVLAGAITLAVLTASFWKALVVTFAYVFGMILPLFIAAYFYDRFNIAQSKFIRGKMFEVEVAKKKIYIHSTNLIAGIIFLVMGITLLALAFSGNAFWAPTYQAEIGKTLNQWSQKLLNTLSGVPDVIWGVLIIGFFLFLLYRARNKSVQEKQYDREK